MTVLTNIRIDNTVLEAVIEEQADFEDNTQVKLQFLVNIITHGKATKITKTTASHNQKSNYLQLVYPHSPEKRV